MKWHDSLRCGLPYVCRNEPHRLVASPPHRLTASPAKGPRVLCYDLRGVQ